MSETLLSHDAEARALAQTRFDRPLVLEAGAGTGKTATLVARILSWCLGPGWARAAEELEGEEAIARRVLEGVVAITFTEAAVAEMAERVGLALGAIERASAPPPGLELALLEVQDENELSSRARALLTCLDRLSVRTIHAFCLRMLSEHPLEAGLPPRFEVDADASAIEEFAREAVEESLREESALRRALLELAVRDVQPETVAAAVVKLTSEGVPPEEIARDRFPPAMLTALQAEMRESLAAFELVAGGRLRAVPKSATVTLRALDDLEALARALEAGDLGRHELAAAVEAHFRERTRLGEWSQGSFNKSELKLLGEHAAAASGALAPAVAALECLRRARLPVMDAARMALGPLVGATRRRLHDSGFATYSDLLTMARDLLRDDAAVRRQERRRLQQVLVDEFQDTDTVQCELVALLGLPDEDDPHSPGLFLVGDPKQSIYGWRSADLAAYDDFKDRVEAAGGDVHRLHVNFRSVPAILDEVERVVAKVMLREARVQPGFERLLACERLEGEAGFRELGRAPVEHWDCRAWELPEQEGASHAPVKGTSVERAAGIEATAIARDILELHLDAGLPWGEFAILLRNVTHQEVFLRALRDRGIPFEVGKDKSYYRRREVVDAAALVRTVLDPQDHLALLTWLRSPAVGVPDAALIPLWTQSFPDLCTRLGRPDDEAARSLSAIVAGVAARVDPVTPGLEAIEGWDLVLAFALQALGRLRAAFEEVEPDDFVELLRTSSCIEAIEAARFLGAYRAANLDRFFREIQEALLDAGTTRHDVLRRLRRAVAEQEDAPEGRPRQERPDAVQIMTIHAAKGLDFGQVYLPRLDNKGKEGRSDDTDAARVGGSWELRLFQAETPGWRAAAEAAHAVEQAERVRLLYVAATRAKRRLVFSGMECMAKDPSEAFVTAQLVANREGGMTSWIERAAASAPDVFGRTCWSDREATWSICELAAPEALSRRGEARVALRLAPPEEVLAQSLRLESRRKLAKARSGRPAFAAASGGQGSASSRHEERAEELLGGAEETAPSELAGEGSLRASAVAAPRAPRNAARAAGSALHRLLETLELGSVAEGLRERAEATVREAGELAPRAEKGEAERLTRELLGRLVGGPCAARLAELGESSVLARELELILASEENEEPIAGHVGAIDLVYRDPESGELVVADHKTEAVESEAEIAAAVQHHSAQLEVYRRALQVALRLPEQPRAELWFLWPGRIVEVPRP